MAQLASLADETPEGRSIVVLAKEKYGLRGRDLADLKAHFRALHGADAYMSGVDLDGKVIRKGAVDAVLAHAQSLVRDRAARGDQPHRLIDRHPGRHAGLRCRKNGIVLGIVYLKDVVKGGIRERLRFRAQHGHPHGDDPPVTISRPAVAIAAGGAGVDDFLAQAMPEGQAAPDPRRAGRRQAGGDVR